MSVDHIIDKLAGDPGYIKFLLIERGRIRSALLARSPLPDAESRVMAFSGSIGNALHNDLIELDVWLETLSIQDRALLSDWAYNSSERQVFGSTKMMRQKKNKRVFALVTEFGKQNA